MENKPYRLDRTKFKMQSFREADMQHAYWQNKSPTERLQAAFYLISVAYDFDINHPPKMDRNVFGMRKHLV
ncbi:MAG: hypothetical protein AAF573_01040 [Bacteroidota bacterium]